MKTQRCCYRKLAALYAEEHRARLAAEAAADAWREYATKVERAAFASVTGDAYKRYERTLARLLLNDPRAAERFRDAHLVLDDEDE